MNYLVIVIASVLSLPLNAMLTPEVAALVDEFTTNYKQDVEQQEVAFRALCIQRFFLLNKEPLVKNSPFYNFEKRLKKLEHQKKQLAARLMPGRAEQIENTFLFYCRTHSCGFMPEVEHAIQSWKKDQN